MDFFNTFETYNTLMSIAAGAMFVASWVILKVRISTSPSYREVRLARNILAIDYFLIAIFNIIRIATTQNEQVNPSVTMLVGMYQTLLITSSLTALVNPAKSKWGWVIWQTAGVTLLLGADVAIRLFIPEYERLMQHTILALYLTQQAVYTFYFFKIYRYTLKRIKDYFDEDEESRIVWVKNRYLGLLLMGIMASLSPINEFWFYSIFVLTYAFVYTYTAIGFVSNYYNYSSMIPTVMKITNEEKEIMEKQHQEELMLEKVKEKIIPSHFENLKKKLDKWVAEQGYLIPNVPMDDILKILDTTRPALRTYMKQTYGMDFSTWRNDLRLEQAHSLLLEHPDHTIETVAELVGYSDTGNFARAFKLKYGVTPRSLMKQ